jgi:hypothetical protein
MEVSVVSVSMLIRHSMSLVSPVQSRFPSPIGAVDRGPHSIHIIIRRTMSSRMSNIVRTSMRVAVRVHQRTQTAPSRSGARWQHTTSAAAETTAAATPTIAADVAPPTAAAAATPSASTPSAPRRRSGAAFRGGARGWTGAPPSSSHFFRFGVPFMLFMVIGSWGYSKLLQPAYDHANSGARNQLYGRSQLDPNAPKKAYEQPEPKRLRTLEEEYERSQQEVKKDFVLKPIPKRADALRTR